MSLRICAIHHVEHSLVYAVNDKRHKIYNRKIIILNLTMAKIRKNFDVSSNPQYLVNPVLFMVQVRSSATSLRLQNVIESNACGRKQMCVGIIGDYMSFYKSFVGRQQ